jgi:prophage tail gpP-like protein
VVGERSGSSFTDTAESVSNNSGKATDKLVLKKRYRPIVIQEDDPTDNAACTQRAQWQRNTHYGRSRPITYTLESWLQDDGELWLPNMMVMVKDAYLRINQELLLTEVHYVLDERSKRCELTVMPKEAFELAELPEPTEDSF